MSVPIPLLVTLFLSALAVGVHAAGVRLENYEYPFPIEIFTFESQKQGLEMAYMDLQPEGGAKGRWCSFTGRTSPPHTGRRRRKRYPRPGTAS